MPDQPIMIWLLGGLLTTGLAVTGVMLRATLADMRRDIHLMRERLDILSEDKVRLDNLDTDLTTLNKTLAAHMELAAHRDHPHPDDMLAFRAFIKEP